jgi:hypothetical protein
LARRSRTRRCKNTSSGSSRRPTLAARIKKGRIPAPEDLDRWSAGLQRDVPDEASLGFQGALEEERKQAHLMRRFLAPFILVVVSIWLGVLVLLLFFEGFHYRGFDLGDGVLSAAIGATAIFGLLGIVLRHYYPRHSDRQ